MGTSTMVGHYVCHLLKDNRWIIFNDEKVTRLRKNFFYKRFIRIVELYIKNYSITFQVALSENPPKELGYLYLYQRID